MTMARSHLFLLAGLLLVGMTLPALAADPIQIQFAALAGDTWYSGSESPGVAQGDMFKSNTYWNPVAAQGNGWLNNCPPSYAGLKYADGTAGASAAGIRIEGAVDISASR